MMTPKMLLLAAVAVASAHAFAQVPLGQRLIFSNVPGTGTNIAPGTGGVEFNPPFVSGTPPTTNDGGAFQQVQTSPDGQWWAVRGFTKALVGTVGEDALFIGKGTDVSTYNTPVRDFQSLGFNDLFLVQIGNGFGVNNSGHLAFWANAVDSANNPSNAIAVWNGSGFVSHGVGGAPVPGRPGFFFFDSDSAHFAADGVSANSRWRVTDNVTTQTFRATVLMRDGVATGAATGTAPLPAWTPETPTGQLVMPAQTLERTFIHTFRQSPDGLQWMAIAELNGPAATNRIALRNGSVLAQEGVALPGSFATPVHSAVNVFEVTSFFSHRVVNNNQFTVHGIWNTGTTAATRDDFILGNNRVIAFTGGNVAGSVNTLRWDDAVVTNNWIGSTVNSFGDTVVIGGTTETDTTKDIAASFNGVELIFREGDPVDLNNNGSFDDNAFIGFLPFDMLSMTDQNYLFCTVGVRDGAGNTLGRAFLRYTLPLTGDVNNDGEVGPADFSHVLEGFGSESGGPGYTNDPAVNDRDQDSNGEIGPADFSIVLANFGRER